MVNIISGMNFLVEALNIDYADIPAAFSFRANPTTSTNILYRDPWATGSSSGILNSVGGNGFFIYSGTGNFNTTNYFELSQNYSLNESTILISYEKLRTKNEILLSSITGSSPSNYAGFNIGINDANKLYLKYWNNVEGSFTFTYTGILSDKNILVINRNDSIVTLGHFNNNTFRFSSQEFEIFQNNFINSNKLFIGGNPNSPSWDSNSPSNFSGYMDRLYIFNNIPFVYADALARGLFSEPTGFAGDLEEYCYITGFLSGSGYSYSTVTGVLVSGFQSGVTGITGYSQITSGSIYTGITGYSGKYLGSYIDNCGRNIDIVEQIALSGEINNEVLVTIALTGITFVTGFTEVDLVGIDSGIENVFVTGLICDSYFNNIGDVLYAYDDNYLASLSYKEISLLTTINSNNIEPIDNDIVEIYAEKNQSKTLDYNINLGYDTLNENYFYIDRAFKQNEVLMFGNGQALIDNGYELIPSGYEIIRSPNFDYFITGTTVETNKFFGVKDYLFYDYFSGRSNFYPRLNNILGEVFYQSSNSGVDAFVFKNGQKLISGIDYSIDRLNSTQLIYGTGTTGFINVQGSRLGENLNLNDNGNILMMTDRSGSFSNSLFIYKKDIDSSWVLHQRLTGLMKTIWTGPNSVISSSFATYLNRQGNVLVVVNTRSIDIFTGSATSNWNLCKTFNYPPRSFSSSVFYTTIESPPLNQVTMNNDGSLIFVNAPFLSGAPSNSRILIFTGSANNGNWEQNGFINPNILYTGRSNCSLDYRQLSLNKNENILAIADRTFSCNPNQYVGHIRILTGSNNNWGLCSIISGSGLGASLAISETADVICTSNPNSGVGGGFFDFGKGAIYIYTGSIFNGWNLKQSITGISQDDSIGRSIKISSDGENILFNCGSVRDDTYKVFKYKGNKNNGWNVDNIYYPANIAQGSPGTYYTIYGRDIVMSEFGETFAVSAPGTNLTTQGTGVDAGIVYTYGEGMSLYFLNEEFSNQLNYFMVREIDHYNNYVSGNSGTLKFNYPFNHGCSQVYYNGIKQKISTNYIENSNYDLISGVFREPSIFKELIYNNTDDFFV
jgi:hypothetical protein